jgi:hypothetical protein
MKMPKAKKCSEADSTQLALGTLHSKICKQENQIKVLEEAICPRVAARLTVLERDAVLSAKNGVEFEKQRQSILERLTRVELNQQRFGVHVVPSWREGALSRLARDLAADARVASNPEAVRDSQRRQEVAANLRKIAEGSRYFCSSTTITQLLEAAELLSK